MTGEPTRQTRKRLATRQRISDVATRLFVERGFDQVRIDEIAEAADVSRMTVFNHFARKEDLFFDLDEQAREAVLSALAHRPVGVPPLESLRLFTHHAVAAQLPYVRFFEDGSDRFLQTIQASETLRARARAIRDELSTMVAGALAQAAGQSRPDSRAALAASLLVATWAVALEEAHRAFQQVHDISRANSTFLELIDRGTRAAQSVLGETPASVESPRSPPAPSSQATIKSRSRPRKRASASGSQPPSS